MKKLFFVFAAAAFVNVVSAQATTAKTAPAANHNHDHEAQLQTQTPAGGEGGPVIINPNAAKLNFKEETYDFGEVPEGPQVTHEFKFTNTGKEPLVLTNVRASCGCTTPSWPKEPVLPGKESAILVTYNTQGRPGNFSKSITITSNSDSPNKVIYIKGEVVKAEPEKSVPFEQPSMLAPKN